jgi:hypothetical protein
MSLMYGQEYDRELNFATDAWTSPNHRAYVAFTVTFLYNNEPLTLILDMVEVDTVHI